MLLKGHAEGGPGTASVSLDRLEVRDAATPPVLAPLNASGTASLTGPTVQFEGKVTDSRGILDLAASGRHDLDAEEGGLTFRAGPLNFVPGGAQPQQLLPVLRGVVSSVAGTLGVSGSAAWSAAGMTSAMVAEIAGGALQARVAALDGIDARVVFDSVWPLATPPGQKVTIRSLDAGIALAELAATFRIVPEGALLVERAAWPWMGGTMRMDGVRLTPGANRHDLTLEVAGLDMAQLFKRIDLEGLAGNGRLSGRLPIQVIGGTPFIRRGRLVADRGGGTIRFTGKAVAAALEGGGESTDILARALENFRYTALEIDLDGETTGAVRLRAHLAGANPDLYDGYPVALNLNLEGDLGELLRGAGAGNRIPEDIRRRLDGQALDRPKGRRKRTTVP